MKNKKVTLISWTIVAILIILVILFFDYKNKVVVPTVGADGKISGNYSIAGIMKIGKPYECTFQKSDGTSQIAGTIYTDGAQVSGNFKIKTDLVKTQFNDFLIIKGGQSYTWTSLSNLGYKYPTAQSASTNASPQEQSQIIGTKDKMQYDCVPWAPVDNSVFETPSNISFSTFK